MDIRSEDDLEQLRRIALTQQVQIRHLLEVLQRQSGQLDEARGTSGDLQEKLALLNALAKQAQKDGEIPPTDGVKPVKKRKKRRRQGPTPQPELKHEQQVFVLDEADRICPSCGGELSALKDQYETSELIDVIAVEYRVIEAMRQKYVCRCGSCIETALGPERAIAGGRYSLDFAIKVVVDKYLDHIPLSRQQRIMKRHGLAVLTTTLWDQLLAIATELRPTYDALKARAMSMPVIGLDQTGWPRLTKRAKRREKNRPWQMWCVTAPDVIVHAIRDDKSEASFRELVGEFVGVIVCDALGTHAAGARGTPIELAGCWAHVRRRFAEAEKDFPDAAIPLGMIRELYDIDQDDDGAHDLATRRRERSKDVLDRLKTWLMAQAVLKKSSIGSAIAYTIGIWPRLIRFAANARIPLDNNATERAIRGPVVGRKNHYGSKSERGTEVAAILYSLLETAKLNGVEPAAYLREAVLAARRGDVCLPHELADKA